MKMIDAWEKLYDSCVVDLGIVGDQAVVTMPTKGEVHYVLAGDIIVTIVEDYGFAIEMIPEKVPTSGYDWYVFLALCQHLKDNFRAREHNCGVYVHTEYTTECVSAIAAFIISPPEDNTIMSMYSIIEEHVDLYMGKNILHQYCGAYPVVSGYDPLAVSWESSAGKILLNGKEKIFPIIKNPISTVSFPQAKDILDQETIEELEGSGQCFVDNRGVHVVPHNGYLLYDVYRAMRLIPLKVCVDRDTAFDAVYPGDEIEVVAQPDNLYTFPDIMYSHNNNYRNYYTIPPQPLFQ